MEEKEKIMIESIKQYYIYPYMKEVEAKIINIDNNMIYLDRTIFYPEGGGQPGDKGFINDIEVLDTQKSNNSIAHILRDSSSFKINDCVKLKLDWDFRYSYMKMHTAQHLISGLLHSHFNVSTVSVHQGSEFLTIEIDNNNFSEEDCYKVEDLANQKIIESKKISYLEMNKDEAEKLNLRRSIKVDGLIRIVKIEDIDLIACGGLHVENTSEIGRILFCGIEKIRNHYRLLFKVSANATNAIRKNDSIIKELCVINSATTDTLVSCNKALIEKNLELERQLRVLKKEKANLFIKALLNENSQRIIIKDVTLENLEFKDLELSIDKVLFLYQKNKSSLRWYIYLGKSFEKYDFNELRNKVLSIIKAKGGGRFPSFQGKGECENINEFSKAFVGYFNE